jgi:hypothetical protein
METGFKRVKIGITADFAVIPSFLIILKSAWLSRLVWLFYSNREKRLFPSPGSMRKVVFITGSVTAFGGQIT